MSAPMPWKQALTGGVGIVAGVALLSVDWTLAQVVAFVGLALVARSALQLVTATPFVGFAGAFAVLDVAGDIGVGITLLAWPNPTELTLGLLVASWAFVRAIAVTTRPISRGGSRPSCSWSPPACSALSSSHVPADRSTTRS